MAEGGEFKPDDDSKRVDRAVEMALSRPAMQKAHEPLVGGGAGQVSIGELATALTQRFADRPDVHVYLGADQKIYLQYATTANSYVPDLDSTPSFDKPALPRPTRTTSIINASGLVEAVVTEDISDKSQPGVPLPPTAVWYAWGTDARTGQSWVDTQRYVILQDGKETPDSVTVHRDDDEVNPSGMKVDRSPRHHEIRWLNAKLYATENTPAARMVLLLRVEELAADGYGDVYISAPDANGHRRVILSSLDPGIANFLFAHEIDADGHEVAYMFTQMSLDPDPDKGSTEDPLNNRLTLFENNANGQIVMATSQWLHREEQVWVGTDRRRLHWTFGEVVLPGIGNYPVLASAELYESDKPAQHFNFRQDVLLATELSANLTWVQGLTIRDVDANGAVIGRKKQPDDTFERYYAYGIQAQEYLILRLQVVSDPRDLNLYKCRVLAARTAPRTPNS